MFFFQNQLAGLGGGIELLITLGAAKKYQKNTTESPRHVSATAATHQQQQQKNVMVSPLGCYFILFFSWHLSPL